jgi:hypothetical protein
VLFARSGISQTSMVLCFKACMGGFIALIGQNDSLLVFILKR